MAVHTPLDDEEIRRLLAEWDGSILERAEGVAEGSIHTTYRVHASGRLRYLRLTEGLPEAAVDFELALLSHLSARGLPVPAPVPDRRGRLRGRLADRPAVLFEALPGRALPAAEVDPGGLAEIGAFLARLHRSAGDFPHTRANPYGPVPISGWLGELRDRAPGLEADVAEALPRLTTALEGSAGFGETAGAASVAVCHCDLFPDNVLWSGDALTGVLDFEMACTAPRILDLAVAILVWGWDAAAVCLDPARCRPLTAAYAETSPLGNAERHALHDACRFVAVRYTVTRIRDFHLSALPAERLIRKDWRAYRDRLVHLESIGAAGLLEAVGL